MAEAVRFELTEDSHPRQFSRLLHSTALPRFLGRKFNRSAGLSWNASRKIIVRCAVASNDFRRSLVGCRGPYTRCFFAPAIIAGSVTHQRFSSKSLLHTASFSNAALPRAPNPQRFGGAFQALYILCTVSFPGEHSSNGVLLRLNLPRFQAPGGSISIHVGLLAG